MTTVDDKSMENPVSHGDDGPPDNAEARFVARARGVLLSGVDSLDGRTRSRLTQARHAALKQLEPGSSRSALIAGRWLAPAGGLAAVALVALVWLGAGRMGDPLPQSAGLNAPPAASPLDDIAIMADTENLELIEEIEFYSWLDAEANLPPVAAGGVG